MRAFFLVLLVACGADTTDTRTVDEVLADLDLADAADCGVVNADAEQCLDRAATSDDEAAQACLLTAFEACEAARVTLVQASVEGAAIRTTLAVAPDGAGGCSIISLLDTTEDAFGPQEITQQTCDSVAADEACPYLLTSGCADPS